MNIWLTSDTHYGHKNIASKNISNWSSGYRKFDSLYEMNQTIINNINTCAKEDDILYHLGDWSFGGISNILLFRNQLICKNIHLILGNHDQHILDKEHTTDSGETFNPIHLFKSVQKCFTGNIGKNKFHLSHYAHRVWEGQHKGVIHLYGHSHGSLPPLGLSMDVGLDNNKEFKPYHINDILTIMSKREIHKNDQH